MPKLLKCRGRQRRSPSCFELLRQRRCDPLVGSTVLLIADKTQVPILPRVPCRMIVQLPCDCDAAPVRRVRSGFERSPLSVAVRLCADRVPHELDLIQLRQVGCVAWDKARPAVLRKSRNFVLRVGVHQQGCSGVALRAHRRFERLREWGAGRWHRDARERRKRGPQINQLKAKQNTRRFFS